MQRCGYHFKGFGIPSDQSQSLSSLQLSFSFFILFACCPITSYTYIFMVQNKVFLAKHRLTSSLRYRLSLEYFPCCLCMVGHICSGSFHYKMKKLTDSNTTVPPISHNFKLLPQTLLQGENVIFPNWKRALHGVFLNYTYILLHTSSLV